MELAVPERGPDSVERVRLGDLDIEWRLPEEICKGGPISRVSEDDKGPTVSHYDCRR